MTDFYQFFLQSICDSENPGSANGKFSLNDLPSIGQALTALHLATKTGVGAVRTGPAGGTGGFAHLAFPKGIADTNDHR